MNTIKFEISSPENISYFVFDCPIIKNSDIKNAVRAKPFVQTFCLKNNEFYAAILLMIAEGKLPSLYTLKCAI